MASPTLSISRLATNGASEGKCRPNHRDLPEVRRPLFKLEAGKRIDSFPPNLRRSGWRSVVTDAGRKRLVRFEVDGLIKRTFFHRSMTSFQTRGRTLQQQIFIRFSS